MGSTPLCGNTWYEAVLIRLTALMVEAFSSDEPNVLSDLAHLPLPLSMLRTISGRALEPFAKRLLTAVDPTQLHSELLFRCVQWYDIIDVDEQDLLEWLSPILKLPNLHRWWSDDLIAKCIYYAADGGDSPLYPVMDAFIHVWLLRRAGPQHPLVMRTLFYDIMASLVSGVPSVDEPSLMQELSNVFFALSTVRPSVIEKIFRSSVAPSLWMAFARDTVTRLYQRDSVCPLVLTPRMALEMSPLATPDLEGIDFCMHMQRILTSPRVFNGGVTPHVSWLGHFTLALKLFAEKTDGFKWDNMSQVFGESILKWTIENPQWWNRTGSGASDPDWTWAGVVVRLLVVFHRPPCSLIYHQAAEAVAQFLVTHLDAHTITSGGGCWTKRVPIFPHLHDLEVVLSLMFDEIIMAPSVLPVFAVAITESGAILDRLCAVHAWTWNIRATTQVMQLMDANSISTLAWTSWFTSPMQRNAQCVAVQSADPTPSLPLCTKRTTTNTPWVSLLRIHALIPTECDPPPGADTLARLLSNQAGWADIHQVLMEWIVRPTPEMCAQMDQWARAADGGCAVPTLFVLERLRRYCAKCVHPPNHPYAATAHSPEGFGGIVGQTLLELASVENMRDACDALWFVVHYAADDVLIATAARWVMNKFGSRLQALRYFALDMADIVSCLEARCALFNPGNEALESLWMGLDLMMASGHCNDKVAYDYTRMKNMLGLLGGADKCHFLFRKLVHCNQWTAWGTIVMCDELAWQRFVRGTPDGREAAQYVFRHFPTAPDDYMTEFAWKETYTAVGLFPKNKNNVLTR